MSTERQELNSIHDLIDVNHILNDQIDSSSKAQNMILMVDDQEFNLNAMEIILEYKLKVNIDKTCVRALGGKEALQIIKEDVKQ